MSQAKNREIVSNWEQLVEKARLRKQKLDESYFLHRFLADFRDLTSWINDIKTVICADELAKVTTVLVCLWELSEAVFPS